MKKQLLIAAVAASMGAHAAVDFSGNYEGVITESGITQELDISMVGSAGNSSVTVNMDDITNGVSATETFVETTLEGIALKGGNYKNQNGSGLLQTTTDAANQWEVSTSVAGASVSAGQTNGDGSVTVDASTNVAGIDVTAQNVSATDRFITIVGNFFGFNTTVETQNTDGGRNTAVSTNANVNVSETSSVNLTGVYMDVANGDAVTQDDGILGDVSDAASGSTVTGVVATLNTSIGGLTTKYIVKNEANTVAAEVDRGAWTFGYSKTENEEAVTSAKVNFAF